MAVAVAVWGAQDVPVKYAREQFGPTIGGGAGVVFGGRLGWLRGGGGLVAVLVFGVRRRGPGHDEVAQRGRGGEDAVEDGVRESEQSWLELLMRVKKLGLKIDPKLAIADGALGFWKALPKVWEDTRQQRCCVHKMANVLNKLPKSSQVNAKKALQDIWMADSKDQAEAATTTFVETYSAKQPRAVECLLKDKEEMLTFYDFPAEHWRHLRTTNPIESTFATVRLRTKRTKGAGSRTASLTMVFKLAQCAQQTWRKLNGYTLLADIIRGVRFKDGIKVDAA